MTCILITGRSSRRAQEYICDPINKVLMLRVVSAAFVSSVTQLKSSQRGVSAVRSQRQISQFLLTAATISILGSSRLMSAAAASTAGECANPQGPVPQSIQNIANEVLKVRPVTPFLDPDLSQASGSDLFWASRTASERFMHVRRYTKANRLRSSQLL